MATGPAPHNVCLPGTCSFQRLRAEAICIRYSLGLCRHLWACGPTSPCGPLSSLCLVRRHEPTKSKMILSGDPSLYLQTPFSRGCLLRCHSGVPFSHYTRGSAHSPTLAIIELGSYSTYRYVSLFIFFTYTILLFLPRLGSNLYNLI